jgi:hypothetical protein
MGNTEWWLGQSGSGQHVTRCRHGRSEAQACHLKDTEDRTRYLLVSLTVPGLSLYYRVQDDAWSFDDPMQATLFKRRPAAKAIQALLRRGVHIVPCKVDEDGVLVLSLLAARTVRGRRLATVPSWRRKKGTLKEG